MPDLTPARPTSGTPIESSWGQQVHDAIEGIQVGTAQVVTGGAASGNLAVTFARPYVTPPTVVASVNLGTGVWVAVVTGPTTTTGTVIGAFHRAGTALAATIPVAWVAIGTPA